MTNKSVKYEVFAKQYLHAVLDISGNKPYKQYELLFVMFLEANVMAQQHKS